MHEPHQVAQKLTSKHVFGGILRRCLQVRRRCHFQLTGCSSIFRSDSMRDASFSCHFVEQPNTPVFFTGTSRFASNASIAFRASWRFHQFLAIAVVHSAFVP